MQRTSQGCQECRVQLEWNGSATAGRFRTGRAVAKTTDTRARNGFVDRCGRQTYRRRCCGYFAVKKAVQIPSQQCERSAICCQMMNNGDQPTGVAGEPDRVFSRKIER